MLNNEPPRLDPQKRTTPVDPPVVNAPIGTNRAYTPSNPLMEVHESLDKMLSGQAHGAPRVFDLFTLLAITVAFALLFAFLKVIEPILELDVGVVTSIMVFFLTLIALCQSLMFGSKKPRLASVYAGPIACIATSLLVAMIYWRQTLQHPESLFSGVCFLVFSPFLGYLAGGMVAGVFFLADKFRGTVMTSNSKDVVQNDDNIFEMENEDS